MKKQQLQPLPGDTELLLSDTDAFCLHTKQFSAHLEKKEVKSKPISGWLTTWE